MKENFINETIKTLFTEPKLQNVLCSLYENYLKVDEISILLNLNVDEVEKCLELLCGTGLVIKKEKATATLYSLKNNKVCDAMLMLKDELNKTIPGNI